MSKVLLTGASGFVGSHILDNLRARGLETAILLRPSSDKTFLQQHLGSVEVRLGSISEPESLRRGLTGITHVIHCAGCTRARRIAEFYEINQQGTRNVVEAVNSVENIERLVHVSRLAAIGPATPDRPARETDDPHPVSEYGKSKLGAEHEVRNRCKPAYVILRPPAVYGPRDYGFLSMFKAVRQHLLPRPMRSQALSLVYVKDLAEVIVGCLQHPGAAGKSFFVANPEISSGRAMAEEIAARMNRWTVPLPLPIGFLWLACAVQEGVSRLTGKAGLLSFQKFPELRAAGWVCDPSLLRRETGLSCATGLKQGMVETAEWYQHNGWL